MGKTKKNNWPCTLYLALGREIENPDEADPSFMVDEGCDCGDPDCERADRCIEYVALVNEVQLPFFPYPSLGLLLQGKHFRVISADWDFDTERFHIKLSPTLIDEKNDVLLETHIANFQKLGWKVISKEEIKILGRKVL